MEKNDKDFAALVENANLRLSKGESPKDVFDRCDEFHEGFASVKLNGKYNYINSDCKLLSDKWFNGCGIFHEGFTAVKMNGKWNFIDRNGNILSDKWFEECWDFHYGFAQVQLNCKWNYIDRNGNLLSDTWFNWCGDFWDGLAQVELNGKCNYVNGYGGLLSDTWFDWCAPFNEGFAGVKMYGKFNFINIEGSYLSDKWFDQCGTFKKGFVWVELNGKDYLLRKDGVLCDYNTKEPVEPDHPVSIDYKKKYEEAIERMKSWARGEHPECFTEAQKAAEFVFPELKESEDERIRKEILNVIHQLDDNTTICGRNYDFQKWIAWLEKQGELDRSDCSYFDKGCKAGISDRQLSDEEMKELLRTEYEKGRYDATTETKWKPTEEQMHVLYNSVLCCLDVEDIPILDTLYRDLKKLQEE